MAKIKPIGYVGSFASGDDRLTESWYTGVYGVRLNMEADQFNTVLVERGDRVSILGTNHPVMATSLVAFDGRFATDFVHHELERTNSGSAHGHHVVDDSIIIYPIYWTLSVNDWFMASGDVQGFLKLAPDVMSIIDKRVNDFLSPTLNIVWMAWDDRLGDGWCTDGLAQGDSCGLEAHLTFAAIVVRACWDLGRSLHLAGSIQDGDRYQATARHLGAILRQQVPNWPYGLGVHSAAHISNAGFAIDQSQDEMDALFDQYLNNSVTICSQCNFDQYWVLQGLTNANRMEHALASVNLCWGTSRALGKGCFWEMYSPFWASLMEDGDQAPIGISFCHPWAAGVSAWLSHQVGGVHPLLPGYEEVMLVPFVSPNYSFVETAVPIPDSVISVTAKLSQGRVVINVNSTKPGFIGVRLLLAGSNTRANGACALDVQGVSIDDKSVQVNSLAEVAAPESALVQTALYQHFVPNVASSFMFLRTPHGYHTIVANYTGGCRPNSAAVPTTAAPPTRMSKPGIPHFPPFPVPSYPARTQMDRVSAGNGLAYYGADGYLLFGNSEDGSNLYKLPTYVRNVTVHSHNYFGWKELAGVFVGKSTTNGTYLPDADSKSKNRTLGMVGVDDQELGRGIIIDVDVVDGEHDDNFTVSLYAVARTSSERYGLRVVDMDSKDVIAPTVLMSNYTNGVWWTAQYKGSLRIRLLSITGAHISAIGFGPPFSHKKQSEKPVLESILF